jgi:hypothetical protein
MAKFLLRSMEVAEILVRPPAPGRRGIFVVEARDARERRLVEDLFETVGELAEVVQVSDGEIMSYAVRTSEDLSLLGKIEWLLKTQFTFSIVERTVSEITYRLIESLCEDTGSELLGLPRCGICSAADPFPARITLRDAGGLPVLEAAYCGPCAARRADRDRKKMVIELLAADRRNFAAIRQARLVRKRRRPRQVVQGVPEEVQTYAIAS